MSMTELLELPEIECRGEPRELGRAHGEQLAGTIQRFVEQRVGALRQFVAERGRPASLMDEFAQHARACLAVAQDWDPEGTEEHHGVAEAAGVDSALLYGAANMTDIRDFVLWPPKPEDEGCSAFALPRSLTREGRILAGQTWDLNPDDLDYVVAVARYPARGPRTWSITCAGCPSLVGMNEQGVAVGTTNIKTSDTAVGVGYLSLIHRALGEPSRARALATIRSAPRAAAHTYWVADAEGADEAEAAATHVAVRSLADTPLVRTNHCFLESLRSLEAEPPNTSSLARLERLRACLLEGGHDVDSLKRLFADRSDGVDSINRYPEDRQGTTTNACFVCEPERRCIAACRGPADRGRWREIQL